MSLSVFHGPDPLSRDGSGMSRKVRYLSHPQVVIDPSKDVRTWSLDDVGRGRVTALARSGALTGTATIISSGETKALETARPLADALGCELTVRERTHENDRSATGFLPPDEFERVADQFFADPDASVRGWETARAAQRRIVAEVEDSLRSAIDGDVLFVGHGGVGTLLYCHLAGLPVGREHDQGAGGGGCYLEFRQDTPREIAGWRPMEDLIARGGAHS